MISAQGERYIEVPPAVRPDVLEIAQQEHRYHDEQIMSAMGQSAYVAAADPYLASTTYAQVNQCYRHYLANPYAAASGIPAHPGQLNQESRLILPELQHIANLGYIPTDSQPGAFLYNRMTGEETIHSPYIFIITPMNVYPQITACIDANPYIARIGYPEAPTDLNRFPRLPAAVRDQCRLICIGVRGVDNVNLATFDAHTRTNYLLFILNRDNPFFRTLISCLPDISGMIGGRKRQTYKVKRRRKVKRPSVRTARYRK